MLSTEATSHAARTRSWADIPPGSAPPPATTLSVVFCVEVVSAASRAAGATDAGSRKTIAPPTSDSSVTYVSLMTQSAPGGRLPTVTMNTSPLFSSSIRYAPCPAATAALYCFLASSFLSTRPTTCFPLMKASNAHTAARSSSGKTYFASIGVSPPLRYC